MTKRRRLPVHPMTPPTLDTGSIDRGHLVNWIREHVPNYFNYTTSVAYDWYPEQLADDLMAFGLRVNGETANETKP